MTQQAPAIPPLSFGWRLRMAAEFAGMNLPRLIDEMGVSKTTINRWTRDQGKMPTPPHIRRWADVCGVDYDWLVTGRRSVIEPMRDPRLPVASAAMDDWDASEQPVADSSPKRPCRPVG